MKLYKHILQSKEWATFKSLIGTPAIQFNDVIITKHKLPFLPYFVGFAPKVNFYEQQVDFDELKVFAKRNGLINIKFDSPNVIQDSTYENIEFKKIIDSLNKYCRKSDYSRMTLNNVLIDLTKGKDQIMADMKSKTRYNIRLAAKKGVEVTLENDQNGFDKFYELYKYTAKSRGFLIKPKSYHQKLFNEFRNKANILIASHEEDVLCAWFLLNDDETIYYVYGGSADIKREFMASSLVCWEAIKLGINLNCKVFDMWGATSNPESNLWGVTKFKLGFGGNLYKYIDTYDFVVNPFMFNLFEFGYNRALKFIKLIKYRKKPQLIDN